MHLYCGIDWATDHHDIAIIDGDGRVVARRRVNNDAGGFAGLLTVLAEAGDTRAVRSQWRSKLIVGCWATPSCRQEYSRMRSALSYSASVTAR